MTFFMTTAMTAVTTMLTVGTMLTARAADDPQQQAEPLAQATDGTSATVLRNERIEVHTDGAGATVAIVGEGDRRAVLRVRDGKVELVNAVPADVEKKLEEVREAAKKKAADAEKQGAAAKAQAGALLQERLEELKEQMQNPDSPQKWHGLGFGMQGSITVIGPDGVKHTQTFGNAGDGNGNGQLPDIQSLLEKALENAGADLPDEIRNKLAEAFKQQDPKPQAVDGAKSPAGGEGSDISRKLDRILERLEKLEKDMGELKAKNQEQE